MSFEDLNPVIFLDRAADVYRDKTAIVYGESRWTYGQFEERVRRLAGALGAAGVTRGDRVAVLAPNIPQTLECCYGPTRLGAILVAINILDHSGAKVLVYDAALAETVRAVQSQVPGLAAYVRIADAAPPAADDPGGGLRSISSRR